MTKGAPVDPVIQQHLRAMRDELGLPYVFPFEPLYCRPQSEPRNSA